ncbi:hypothetical protein V491_09286 [Pseudogymnoascus sp. VKM F-3775]|nr:hypothetical protein V491_09286 [Pseudogymnoascus sp. VKM F-3775]
MSDISSYQGKALGTRIIRGYDSRRMPGRQYRQADGVESYSSSHRCRPVKTANAASAAAAADWITTNDGTSSHPLGDLSQHDRSSTDPRSEIIDKFPGHPLQGEGEELADLNPASKNAEEETSSVIVAHRLDQRVEEFLYQPNVPNPVDDATSEGPDNMDGAEVATVGVKSAAGSRQYERPWLRTLHESGGHKSGDIPSPIDERISVHDEPVSLTSPKALARPGLATSMIQPASAPMTQVDAGRTSSPSILSKPAESSLFHPHVLHEAAVYRRHQTLRSQSAIHRGDLPTRPAPAKLLHISMAAHSLSQEPGNIARATRDIAMPAVAHVRNSTMDRELAFRRDFVTPRLEGDILNTDHLQDYQLHYVPASYDGITSLHSYNTEIPVEPSTLESIYEDASDEPISVIPESKKPTENGHQIMGATSFTESARKAAEFLRGSPVTLEPSVESSDFQNSTIIKSKEAEPEVYESQEKPGEKSQAISPLDGVAKKVDSPEHPSVLKRGWPPYKNILPVKSASSSIYSQPESRSLMSDIRAAFIRGEDDVHRYERLAYRGDSKGTLETLSSGQRVKSADQKGSGQLTQSPEPKSPSNLANIKRPTLQDNALFGRRLSRRAGAIEHIKNGPMQRAMRRRVPSKSSQLERFSRRFRPGRSNSSSKNIVSAEELLASKDAASEEYETNSTKTDKQMSAISEKKTRGPKNWFEGVLSFHKKGTDQSTSLFTNRRSRARLNREVSMSGFIPYDKHGNGGGSVRKKDTEDTERLIIMIENLERRLDEALYPAHKAPGTAVVVDTPQQQITVGVESRTTRSPILREPQHIQQDGSGGGDGVEASRLRSRFEKVCYGSDKNGAMRNYPLDVESSLRSNEADNMSMRMSSALRFTSSAMLPTEGVSTSESLESERGIVSVLGDNVTSTRGHAIYRPKASRGARMKPIDPDYYYPSGGTHQRKSQYKTFVANVRKRATVIPRSRERERELSKERILRYIKAHNAPPIQPRRSSRAIRTPRGGDGSQVSDGRPASQFSERVLRAHTNMDGALEADDEMESEIEYITPRRKRNRASVRRQRLSYEEAHHVHFLHGERENPGQIFEWPPHITRAGARADRASTDSNNTQRVYVTARSRQNRGAGDLSPTDERLVTIAAGFSVAFIFLLLSVYIAFGPENRYALSI